MAVPEALDGKTGGVEPTPWMNSKDAAEELGVAVRTLYRFIDQGELPAYKLGRVIRLKRRDIDDFIESRRLKPGSLRSLYSSSDE